jgi:hypothetical protein
MESKALDEKFTQTELSTVRSELVQLGQAARIKDERLRQMEASMRALQDQFSVVFEILSHNPNEAQIKVALSRKEGQRKPG